VQCEYLQGHVIEAGVPKGSVLGPKLYLLYTADIPTSDRTTLLTVADDTSILSRSKCPLQASVHLAGHLTVVKNWLANWRFTINEQKGKHATITLNRRSCPPLTLNNVQIPRSDSAIYLEVHLDRRCI